MAGLLSSSMQGALLKLPAAAPISAPPSRTLTAVVAHTGAFPSRRQTASSKRPLSTPMRASELTAIDTFTAELDELEGMIDGEYEEVPVHTVTVHDRERGVTYTVDVPQDQYILQTAEEEGIKLPFACRHGCCTACAVRVYEKAEGRDPERVGRMVGIQPNGLAALRCIDPTIADAFPSQGAHVPSLWQLSPSGEVLLEAMAPADGRFSIRWGLALEVLQSFLPASCVHQGCEFTGHVEQANGHVTAHFTRHEQPLSAEADLLMGTDGVRAAVRQHVLKEADLLIGTNGVRSAVRQHVLREGEERERWGPPQDDGRTMWLGAAPRETEVRGKLRALFDDWPAYKDVIEVGGGELSRWLLARLRRNPSPTPPSPYNQAVPPDLFLERRVLDVPPLSCLPASHIPTPPSPTPPSPCNQAAPPDLYLERRVLDVPPLPRWRNGRILIIGGALSPLLRPNLVPAS
ncbi:unnamed protein product [Closterium sp. NIES-65]|nr:unnamed protein product [Closterium sp. NIES-65]